MLIYAHTCTLARMHACKQQNTYTHICTHLHASMHTHAYGHTYTHAHMQTTEHLHACTHACMHANNESISHSHSHTHSHSHPLTHTPTHTHTHTHAHTECKSWRKPCTQGESLPPTPPPLSHGRLCLPPSLTQVRHDQNVPAHRPLPVKA